MLKDEQYVLRQWKSRLPEAPLEGQILEPVRKGQMRHRAAE